MWCWVWKTTEITVRAARKGRRNVEKAPVAAQLPLANFNMPAKGCKAADKHKTPMAHIAITKRFPEGG